MINLKYKPLFIFLGIASITTGVLANTQSDYQSAQAYITNQHFSEILKASVQNAKATLPASPHNPEQKKYYAHPDAINQDAMTNVATSNSVGNLIRTDALIRPKMIVNQNSPEVKFSQKVQNNAKEISDGTYKDCNKKTITAIAHINKACSTGLQFKFDCVKSLGIKVKEKEVTKNEEVSLPGQIQLTGSSSSTVNMPSEKGFVTGLSMHVWYGPWTCYKSHYLKVNGVIIGSYHGSFRKNKCIIPISRGGLKIVFSNHKVTLTLVDGFLSSFISGSIYFSYIATEKAIIKNWTSSCISMPNGCQAKKRQCLKPGSTKTIDGVSVSADCWEENVSYQCGSAMSNDCKSLEHEGCTQIGSQCIQKEAGICERYEETWSCPDKKTIGTGLQCGKRFYCMDGSCQSTQKQKNKDFGKSVTELDAVASAGGDVRKQDSNPERKPNSIRIFTGHAAHCREVVLGTLNCCKDRGWAKGIFANCNSEERALGHAKEKGGLVVSVGRYCSAHVLGYCTEHKQGYCIFPSRIAYDIQKYGRQSQLGHGFGDAKNPDCSGLSTNEIGKINFNHINFSNVVNSVTGKAKWPNVSQSESNIEKQIREAIARKAYD